MKIISSKWTLAAYKQFIKYQLGFKSLPAIYSMAHKTWDIAPGENAIAPPAFFLPNQLERITDWAFTSEHPGRAMEGGCVAHKATRGFLLKDVWLIDGSLYKNNAHLWLSPRSRWWPKARVERVIDRGAMYCTAMGNKYFGQWLLDDCVTYSLARTEGVPVTTAQAVGIHTLDYEAKLDMHPLRLHNAFFRELVIFDDFSENRHRHLRFRAMSDRILSCVNVTQHPGVFILRGSSGSKRLLKNEIEIAEHLRDHRGFSILDPRENDVQTIVATCAGAKTVVGVEGSQLMHGIIALQPGGSVLTLQPPDRFYGGYKNMTDRDHQNFGFVIGRSENMNQRNGNVERDRTTPWTGVDTVHNFNIDIEEVERTLDLFPA